MNIANAIRPHFAPRSNDGELLLARYAGSQDLDERELLLQRIVIEYISLADALARRYAYRGIELDDLRQVARLALIKAVHRYQPADNGFVAYAMPTINGELKRHFRDVGWVVRPPRALQDDPAVLRGFRPISLGAERPGAGGALGDAMTSLDQQLERLPLLLSLEAALTSLDARQRAVLYWRFVEERSQAEIGERLGVSQVQVSRILLRVLSGLRAQLEGADLLSA